MTLQALQWSASPGGTLTADHIDCGKYEIEPTSWMRDRDSWRLSYSCDPIGNYRYPSAEEAKAFAEKHHAATHRKNLWARYMADNDPPGVGDGQR